jgi:hypothetical protein
MQDNQGNSPYATIVLNVFYDAYLFAFEGEGKITY